MALRLRIGESSKSSKMVSLLIAKRVLCNQSLQDRIINIFVTFQCQELMLQSAASMYRGSYQRGSIQLSRKQSMRAC